MALNTITLIKLPDGTEIMLADYTDRPLFSSVDIADGATDQDIILFQLEAGRQVAYAAEGVAGNIVPRTATENDTNISTPGAMASDEALLVYAIKPVITLWDFTPCDFTTRAYTTVGTPVPTLVCTALLMNLLLIELEISEKTYAQADFGYFNPGFGPFGVTDVIPRSAANPGRSVANNGLPSQEAVRSFVVPHHIGGQEKYKVHLRNNPGAALNVGTSMASPQADNANFMATVKVFLEGLYKRPTA